MSQEQPDDWYLYSMMKLRQYTVANDLGNGLFYQLPFSTEDKAHLVLSHYKLHFAMLDVVMIWLVDKTCWIECFLCAFWRCFVVITVVHIVGVKRKSLTAPVSCGRSLTACEIKWDVWLVCKLAKTSWVSYHCGPCIESVSNLHSRYQWDKTSLSLLYWKHSPPGLTFLPVH